LTELVNIGVSRAANALRELVGEEVFLNVPSLAILSRAGVLEVISQPPSEHLVAVRQVFQGEFSGSALFIFPETNSLELVRAVIGGALPLEDIVELEHEALAEIGNIILNSCMATIANLLQRGLAMSLPEIVRGPGAGFFDPAADDTADGVLFIHINFSFKGRKISGYVAIVMDFLSLEALQALVSGYIRRTATSN